MCGIAGVYNFGQSCGPVDLAELRAIRDSMVRRGPDAHGEWVSGDERVALGHRRLSIIDLSARGTQPMHTPDGRLVISFNGEIYNYRALRTELEASGVVFATRTDTEVLLHLYAAYGAEMLTKLRGMFAFAVWDEARHGLFLARDEYGIKPLYYQHRDGVFRFASQVSALLAGRVSRQPDPAGVTGFYLWGSVPEPFTWYRDISALPAGQSLWVDAAGLRPPRPYASIADSWSAAAAQPDLRPVEERQTCVADALRDSVRHHMAADVPVGVFLSGGIDSGALVGLMREQHNAPIAGTTLRFDEFAGRPDDEAPLAAELAALYGLSHTVRDVSRSEFDADLPLILDAMDQPSIDGINTWFASKSSAEQGLKVVVSGLGGDELFGGYSSFSDVPNIVRVGSMPARVPGVGRALRALLTPLARRTALHPKLAGALEYAKDFEAAYFLKRGLFMPWELEDLLPAEFVVEGLGRLEKSGESDRSLPRHPFAAVATLEAARYMRNQLLRDTDWASMAHSLEVRVPLVDTRLLRTVAPLIIEGGLGTGKSVLAQAPHPALPRSVTERTKTGFTTPVQRWMEHSPRLADWRRIPSLARAGCPWARRFAYVVAQRDTIR